MPSSLANKVALVTGGGRGIGKTLVLALLSNNVSKVYVLDKSEKDLEKLRQETDPNRVIIHEIDLTNWNETAKLINSIKDPINYLINNAGVLELMDVGSVTEANVDLHFNLNVKTVINVTQCVSNNMLKNQIKGSIVNISSIATRMATMGHLSYGSSKSAVNGLTRTFALELGLKGIRVNAVMPAVTMTELAKVVWSDETKAAMMRNRIPLRRFAELDDVSNAILFLLSEESSFLNGVFLPVDGGLLIG